MRSQHVASLSVGCRQSGRFGRHAEGIERFRIDHFVADSHLARPLSRTKISSPARGGW